MARLPDSFEKDYLDLMQPIVSEGTIKNRRNLLVYSFSICTVYILDKSLLEFKLFGVHLVDSNPSILLYIALSVVLFWSLMFIMHSIKDKGLNKEREIILVKHVFLLRERMNGLGGKIKNDHIEPELSELKMQHSIYEGQRIRLHKVGILNQIISFIESTLPLGMAVIAALFIIRNIHIINSP